HPRRDLPDRPLPRPRHLEAAAQADRSHAAARDARADQALLRRAARRGRLMQDRPVMTEHDPARAPRPSRILVVATGALIATIAGGNLLFLDNLRQSQLLATESQLSRHSLMLAEQSDRSFKSVDLVLSGIADYIGRQGVSDTASYDRLMSRYEVFRMLKAKTGGLPDIEAVTLIDAQGRLVNFSRSWPIPDVDVADRDYYMVLKDDPKLESYISVPLRNRATGSWNIYVARRLNDPDGAFLGL